jgi:hypothetical protein
MISMKYADLVCHAILYGCPNASGWLDESKASSLSSGDFDSGIISEAGEGDGISDPTDAYIWVPSVRLKVKIFTNLKLLYVFI